MNPLRPGMLCANFVWYWVKGRNSLKLINIFSLCRYYLSLKKVVVLQLNKFEYTLYRRIPFAKCGWNWPVQGSGGEDENEEKLITGTDMRSAFSSGELKSIKSNPKKQITLNIIFQHVSDMCFSILLISFLLWFDNR